MHRETSRRGRDWGNRSPCPCWLCRGLGRWWAPPCAPDLVVPRPVLLLGWRERGCPPRCAGEQRETEAGRAAGGLQRCSAPGPPTLLPSKPWHIVPEVGAGAGGHRGAGGQVNAGNSLSHSWRPLWRCRHYQPCSPPGVPLLLLLPPAPALRWDPELSAPSAPCMGCPVLPGPPTPLSPAHGWGGFGFPRGAEGLGGGWDWGAARSEAAAVTFAGG